MNRTYHIFGLNIQSAIFLPAPHVAGLPPGLSPDVVIEFSSFEVVQRQEAGDRVRARRTKISLRELS